MSVTCSCCRCLMLGISMCVHHALDEATYLFCHSLRLSSLASTSLIIFLSFLHPFFSQQVYRDHAGHHLGCFIRNRLVHTAYSECCHSVNSTNGPRICCNAVCLYRGSVRELTLKNFYQNFPRKYLGPLVFNTIRHRLALDLLAFSSICFRWCLNDIRLSRTTPRYSRYCFVLISLPSYVRPTLTPWSLEMT